MLLKLSGLRIALTIFIGGALARFFVDSPPYNIMSGFSYDVTLHSQNIHYIFFFILQNNLKLNFLIILSSVLLSLPVFIFLISNGFFLADFIISNIHSLGPYRIAALILPHGILELVALFWSASLSFNISAMIYRYLIDGKDLSTSVLLLVFKNVLCIVILTVISALIETYITIRLIL